MFLIKYKNKLPFITLGLALVLMYSTALLGYNDDYIFQHAIDNQSLFDFLLNRYETWTSRLLIESLLVFFTNFKEVWRISNIILWIFFAWNLSLILNKDKDSFLNWSIVAFIIGYHHFYLGTAGWIATSLNYNWPLILSTFSIVTLSKIYRDEKVSKVYISFSILSILIATNVEQMAFIMFLILIPLIYVFIKSKKDIKLPVLLLIIVSLNLIFILTCPGNYARKVAETVRYFPDFDSLRIIRLIDISLSSTLYPWVINSDIIYILTLLIPVPLIFKKYENTVIRLISTLPISIALVFSILYPILSNSFQFLEVVKNALSNVGTGFTIDLVASFIPIFIIVCAFVSYVLTLYFLFKDDEFGYFLPYLALVAFASRFIIGLSPTVWASQDRTFIYMQFLLVFITLYILKKNLRIVKNYIFANNLIFILFLLSLLNNIYNITFFFRDY